MIIIYKKLKNCCNLFHARLNGRHGLLKRFSGGRKSLLAHDSLDSAASVNRKYAGGQQKQDDKDQNQFCPHRAVCNEPLYFFKYAGFHDAAPCIDAA